MRHVILVVVLATTLVVDGGLGVASAQGRPDFSGEWVLNRAGSLLQAETAAVESGTVRIQHKDLGFAFQRTFIVNKQPFETSFELQADGREIARTNQGLASKARLEWQGDSLLLTVLINAPRGVVSNVVRYEVLDAGRVLRAIEDVGGAVPGHHNVWVYERR